MDIQLSLAAFLCSKCRFSQAASSMSDVFCVVAGCIFFLSLSIRALYWTLWRCNFIGSITRAWLSFGLVFFFPLHASILEPVCISLLEHAELAREIMKILKICIQSFAVEAAIHSFTYHILIWRSVRQSACAISILLRRVKYRLKWNSFSSSSVWYRVYVWRPRFRSARWRDERRNRPKSGAN